jgi:hypothetical protein
MTTSSITKAQAVSPVTSNSKVEVGYRPRMVRITNGSMFVFRGVRNRVRRTRRTGFATKANHWLSARCTIAKEQKVRPPHCAAQSVLHASPGCPSWPPVKCMRLTHGWIHSVPENKCDPC